MRIKPVLVPDHDANDLRRLMDSFAEAATGPTRQQLAESRAAVAAAQGVAEQQVDELSIHKMLKYGDAAEKDRDALNQKWDNRTASEKEKERVLRHEKGEQRAADKIKQKTGKLPVQIGKLDRLKHAITREGVSEGSMYSDEEVSWEKGGRRAPTGAFRNPAAEPMPVNKYIAQELDTLLKLAQDQVDDITNRSRDGYGNKKSSGLEDAIFELSGVSNGFHSSMAEGVAELQELNSGLPRIGNWIMRNLKKVGNRIDLPQLIKQETSNNQGVTETHDNDARAVLRNRIVADVLNFYSLNDRIPSIKEFSRPVRAKLNALEFDERSTVFRQAVVQALKLLGKQGMSAALTLDEHGDPWEDPNYDPRGGGETRSPEQIAKDNAEHAILSKKLGLKNTNKLPDIKDDMLKMMNHFRSQHSDKKDVSETADGVKYGVFAKGGSVGSQRFRDDPLKTFDTKEEATADARRRRSGLSKGERGYYGMGYVVKPIRGDVDEGMIDNIKNTVRAANYDRLARRSNSQAVAGGGFAPPAQFKSLSAKGDQRAQKAQDIRKGSAEQVDEKSEAIRHGNNSRSIYHVDESVDPVEQLRADIRRFAQ